MSDFKNYYLSKSKEERSDYAGRASTTPDYIECHLLDARKVPRPRLMNALVDASDGEITLADLAVFFNRQKKLITPPHQEAA